MTTKRSTAFIFSDSERPAGVGSATTRVDVKRIAVRSEERMVYVRYLQVILLGDVLGEVRCGVGIGTRA